MHLSRKQKIMGSNPVVGYNLILFCIMNYIISSVGAVGSASVLCTGGPGFEPLTEHYIIFLIGCKTRDARFASLARSMNIFDWLY